MTQNQNEQHDNPLLTQFIVERDAYISKQVAQEITKFILQQASEMIEKREKFKDILKKFSRTKIIKNIEEVNTLNLYEETQNSRPLRPAGLQPVPLLVDSLLPKSADIDQENTYKKNLKNKLLSEESSFMYKKRKIQNVSGQTLYLKLDLKQQSEDGFTKQLRRMQEQKVNKLQAQTKAKQLQISLLNAKLKDKKKQRQQVFSYDYSGSQIKLRPQAKSNLISKLVNDKINNITKTVKEAFDDRNPTTVNASLVKNQKKNSLTSLKAKEDVRFNDNRSLSEGITVGGGIRYSFQGKVLQGKVKSLSTIELKKSMHHRMLSKQEFQKVRSINGSLTDLNSFAETEKETIHRQTKTQLHNQKLTKVNVKSQKIIVNSQNLKKKMLQPVNGYEEQKRQLPNPQSQKIDLNFVDIFNMNYLKSGGSFKEQKQKKSDKSGKKSSLSLPKIIHTSFSNSFSIKNMPKERQKLKNTNQVILQLRKKFEEKLRL